MKINNNHTIYFLYICSFLQFISFKFFFSKFIRHIVYLLFIRSSDVMCQIGTFKKKKNGIKNRGIVYFYE